MRIPRILAAANVMAFLFCLPAAAQVNNGTLPATASVSQRACQNMQHLVDIGLVQLPAGCRDVAGSHFTRDEMTNLTLQAMSRLGMDAQGRIDGTQDVRRPGYRETLALRSELYKDLQKKGMITDPTLLTDLSPSSEATDEKKTKSGNTRLAAKSAMTMSSTAAIRAGTGATANCAAASSWKAASTTTGMPLA